MTSKAENGKGFESSFFRLDKWHVTCFSWPYDFGIWSHAFYTDLIAGISYPRVILSSGEDTILIHVLKWICINLVSLLVLLSTIGKPHSRLFDDDLVIWLFAIIQCLFVQIVTPYEM